MTLEERWMRLWRRLGVPSVDNKAIYADLIRRYSEPSRRYHTLEHIEHCLEQLDMVQSLAANLWALEFALWYHDAVYDPKAEDNEERSAELAMEVASAAKLPAKFCLEVGRLVLATKHFSLAASGGDSQLIADIDLSGLALPHEKFEKNWQLIRAEYAWVPEDQFNADRSSMLRSLCCLRIFKTKFFYDLCENAARQNIQRKLASL